MIENEDVFSYIKRIKNCSINTTLCDPPYNLSSEWTIPYHGRPETKGHAIDFMDKWGGLNGDGLKTLFSELYRVTKHGGYCLMFGLDRQLMPFQYYAVKHGFEVCQSLYWYFISNFPKATDASKAIDKRLGAERTEIIGKRKAGMSKGNFTDDDVSGGYGYKETEFDITAPSTYLAKQFDGYKYGVAPLKQVLETVMVFRKPPKSGSVLTDIMTPHKELSPSALDIDGNRISLNGAKPPSGSAKRIFQNNAYAKENIYGDNTVTPNNGRYPAQMFVSKEASEIIDKQSGITKSSNGSFASDDYEHKECVGNFKRGDFVGKGDTGGASRILHTIPYEAEEIDLLTYVPKVSSSERNAGCEAFETKEQMEAYEFKRDGSLDGNVTQPKFNIHPTLKPIHLIKHIASLFKLPDECNQKWLVPFAGSGSEIIGIMKAGTKEEQISGCELSNEYFQILKARVKYWKNAPLEEHEIENDVDDIGFEI